MMKHIEVLHYFELPGHDQDTLESMYPAAMSAATHEYKEQAKHVLTTWDDNFAVLCVDVVENTYFFEVSGTYKYVALPDDLL